ncbi:hypothetical protein [Thalassomonas sp. RHCl1]|uniref:hypothetical protein n=1 Tax=Thalassomonas sp. RHCl1 TaxID=2995320 RepID=UPI00248D0486|nr:hypothetical protein [Thalassomonas sp. RHCl1]
MDNEENKNRELFENALRGLEADIANAGTHLIIDSHARQAYAKQIKAMAIELRSNAMTGRISWLTAAEQAQDTRNIIMQIIRTRSTPVGLAMAQQLKHEGKTLNELIARKTKQLHGQGIAFDKLSAEKQNAVYAEIIKSAGKSNPKVTALMKNLSRAGRGLIFVSIALSVYTVATAENKFDAAGEEIAVTGAGIGGGIAGGAMAGLACGPGAPVCVTVGAFLGGALAAFGVAMVW